MATSSLKAKWKVSGTADIESPVIFGAYEADHAFYVTCSDFQQLFDKFTVRNRDDQIAKQIYHAIELYQKSMKKDRVAYHELIALFYHYKSHDGDEIANEIHDLCVTATEYLNHEGLSYDKTFLRSAEQTTVTTIRQDSIYEINLEGRKMCMLRLPTSKDKRFSLSAILGYVKGEGGASIGYRSKEDSSWVLIGSDSAGATSVNSEEDIANIIEKVRLPSDSPTKISDINRISVAKPITMAPISYQTKALNQLFSYWKRSTAKTHLTIKELEGMFAAGPSLRDGYNPIFEPLSVETVLPGFYQLIEDGVIVIESDKITLSAHTPRDFGQYLIDKDAVSDSLRKKRDKILADYLPLSERHEYPITLAFLGSIPLIRRSEAKEYEKRAKASIEADCAELKQRGVINFSRQVKMENIANNVIGTMTIPDDT